MKAITHLNIVCFKTAVAALKDKKLRGRPYVIAGAKGGRALALDCSPEAIRQGIEPGMTLALAERMVKELIVLPPDLKSCEEANREIEKVVSQYAPLWENDGAGNLYLDITGTSSLFGPPADCSSRVLNDILQHTDIRPAAGIASNKLVSKVATRAIRPMGMIQVRDGTEAEFLSHQDIRILPGMGQKLLQTALVTGFREIGELSLLSPAEAIALFGNKGPLLRDMSLGIDSSGVEQRRGTKTIRAQADFEEDTIEETAIRGAMESLAENVGFSMRRDKSGTTLIRLLVNYADGMRIEGMEKPKRAIVLDRDIFALAERVYNKIAIRRIQIRSIALSLEALVHLSYEPDLFEPENSKQKLQEAIDKIQNRYGLGKITKGMVLAASHSRNEKRLMLNRAAYG